MNIFNMTIVPINPPYDDAVKNLSLDIARRVEKHNFFFISSPFGEQFKPGENVEFMHSPAQKKGRQKMSKLQQVFVFLLILVNFKKIDLFQFFITPRPYFAKAFKRLLKRTNKRSIQIVSSVHTLYEKNKPENIQGLFFGDYIVTYSDFAMRKLKAAGVGGVTRIYPGIDTSRFDDVAVNENYFPQGDLSRKAIRIVYAGSYRVLKNSYSFKSFCGIVKNVVEAHRDVRFIMACRMRTAEDRRLKNEFQAIIEAEGIKEHFIMLDTIPDIPELFSGCDIGIMPAKETMSGILEIPMVILEMAYLGKPVIYGHVPPLNELADRKLGIMAKDAVPEAYSDEIIRLIRDEAACVSVGENSRKAVMRFFNIEKTAAEYGKLYDTLFYSDPQPSNTRPSFGGFRRKCKTRRASSGVKNV